GRDFFSHHDLGKVMSAEDEDVRRLIAQVRSEPEPDPSTVTQHVYAPFPADPETPPGPGTPNVSYAVAIRAAIDKLITRRNGFMLGQDVGRLGGVMQASAGIKGRHSDRIIDSPLNEP